MDKMLKEIVSLRMNSDTVIVQFFFMFNDGTVIGHLSLCSMMALHWKIFLLFNDGTVNGQFSLCSMMAPSMDIYLYVQ